MFKSLGLTEKALESSRNCARDGMILFGPNHPLTLESLRFLSFIARMNQLSLLYCPGALERKVA